MAVEGSDAWLARATRKVDGPCVGYSVATRTLVTPFSLGPLPYAVFGAGPPNTNTTPSEPGAWPLGKCLSRVIAFDGNRGLRCARRIHS